MFIHSKAKYWNQYEISNNLKGINMEMSYALA